MEELLDIRDVAKYLRIDYQTAYKLVSSGQIPAARIGKLYRIKKSDLHGYFEERKAEAARGAGKLREGKQCAYCGKPIISLAATSGRCSVCGERLCNDCSILEKRTTCREHSGGSDGASARRCGFCAREVSGGWRVGAGCAAEGCERVICKQCVQERDIQYCLEHTPTDASIRGKVEELKSRGQRALTSIEAKILENNFIDRVRNRANAIQSFYNPVSRSYVARKLVSVAVGLSNQAGSILEGAGKVAEIASTMPLGSRLSFDLALKKGLRKKEKICSLYAVSATHSKAYRKHGYDSKPATYKELTEILGPVIRKAEDEKVLHVAGIASPTGWDEQARDYISGADSRKRFSSAHVSAALVDSSTGALWHNRDDEKVAPFLNLFVMESDEALRRQCEEFIRESLLSESHVSLSKLLMTVPVMMEAAKEVFERLAKTGEYVMDEIKDIGFVLTNK